MENVLEVCFSVYMWEKVQHCKQDTNHKKDPIIIVSQTTSILVFNSLPNDKMLDLSKLKAFADDKMNRIKKSRLVSGRVENIVGKGENAGYQHFLLFPQYFQKPSHLGSLKVGIVWERVKLRIYMLGFYFGS